MWVSTVTGKTVRPGGPQGALFPQPCFGFFQPRHLHPAGAGAAGLFGRDQAAVFQHPQMLEELMAEFGVLPASTVMIGDTSHDLLMARNAGVDALAVTYGAHPHDHLLEHAALACLHDVRELDAWLKTNA